MSYRWYSTLASCQAGTVGTPGGNSAGDKTVTKAEKVSGGGVTSEIVDSVASVFQGARLFRSIAFALILLLAAAHLRVWLRTAPPA